MAQLPPELLQSYADNVTAALEALQQPPQSGPAIAKVEGARMAGRARGGRRGRKQERDEL